MAHRMIIRGEVWEVWMYFGFLLYGYERGWSLKALSCLFVHLVYLAKPHLDLLFVHIINNSIIMSKVSLPNPSPAQYSPDFLPIEYFIALLSSSLGLVGN